MRKFQATTQDQLRKPALVIHKPLVTQHEIASLPSSEVGEQTRNLIQIFDSARALLEAEHAVLFRPTDNGLFVLAAAGKFQAWKTREINSPRDIIEKIAGNAEPTYFAVSNPFLQAVPMFRILDSGSFAFIRLVQNNEPYAFLGFAFPNHTIDGDKHPKHLALSTVAKMVQDTVERNFLQAQVSTLAQKLKVLTDLNQEIEVFYHQFSRSIKQCFWIYDLRAERNVFASANFESVFEHSAKVLERTGFAAFATLVNEQDKDRVNAEAHLALEFKLDTEFRITSKNGAPKWIWLRCFPSEQESPLYETTQIVFIADDITEKKNLENLSRASEMDVVANSKNRAVSDLANAVANEMTSAISTLKLGVDNLNSLGEKSDVAASLVKAAATELSVELKRLSQISRSLIGLGSTSEAASKENVSLTALFSDLRALCQDKLKAAKINLVMPDVQNNIYLYANRSQIQQSMHQLILNAHDAVLGLPERYIELEWVESNDSIFLYVTDSGSGIPVTLRGKIFEPYFTTKHANKASGMGLTLAENLISKNGGSLRLDTHHLHTRFCIQLPKGANV